MWKEGLQLIIKISLSCNTCVSGRIIKLTQKLTKVMPIILGRVLFSMITRRQDSHLVPVNGVVMEEMASLLVYLPRTVLVAPKVKQFLVHWPRTQFGDFSEISEDREFFVSHAHIGFIWLDIGSGYGFQFCSRSGIEEAIENREVERVASPCDELLQVDLADRTNWVQLSLELALGNRLKFG